MPNEVDHGSDLSQILTKPIGGIVNTLGLTPALTADLSPYRSADTERQQRLVDDVIKQHPAELDDIIVENNPSIEGLLRANYRNLTNKRSGILGKLIGLVGTNIGYPSAHLMRSPAYLPDSNVVISPWDNEGSLSHELGHATDFNSGYVNADDPTNLPANLWSKGKRDVYRMSYGLLPQWHELQAWQKAQESLEGANKDKESKRTDEEVDLTNRQLAHIRDPFLATYAAGGVLEGVPGLAQASPIAALALSAVNPNKQHYLHRLEKAHKQKEASIKDENGDIVIGRAIIERELNGLKQCLMIKRGPSCQYEPNTFAIPGGHIEDYDASIKDGIIREIKEETGIKLKDVEMLPAKYKGDGFTVEFARAKVKDEKVDLSNDPDSESTYYRWFSGGLPKDKSKIQKETMWALEKYLDRSKTASTNHFSLPSVSQNKGPIPAPPSKTRSLEVSSKFNPFTWSWFGYGLNTHNNATALDKKIDEHNFNVMALKGKDTPLINRGSTYVRNSKSLNIKNRHNITPAAHTGIFDSMDALTKHPLTERSNYPTTKLVYEPAENYAGLNHNHYPLPANITINTGVLDDPQYSAHVYLHEIGHSRPDGLFRFATLPLINKVYHDQYGKPNQTMTLFEEGRADDFSRALQPNIHKDSQLTKELQQHINNRYLGYLNNNFYTK